MNTNIKNHFTGHTDKLKIPQKTLLAIIWSGAKEVGMQCPFCGHDNLIRTESIIEENSFVCASCKRTIKIVIS